MKFRHSGITEQRKAAFHRKRDASRLLEHGAEHTRGSMYLGGYAIECKVKAIAMECRKCQTLDQLRSKLGITEDHVYTHGLERLIKVLLPSGALDRLLDGPAADAFRSQVNRWTPQWRYNPQNVPAAEAARFMDAVQVVWDWLERNT